MYHNYFNLPLSLEDKQDLLKNTMKTQNTDALFDLINQEYVDKRLILTNVVSNSAGVYLLSNLFTGIPLYVGQTSNLNKRSIANDSRVDLPRHSIKTIVVPDLIDRRLLEIYFINKLMSPMNIQYAYWRKQLQPQQ